LIKFTWSRLVHAPCPSVLVFVGSYIWDYLLNPKMTEPYDSSKGLVQMAICNSFDVYSSSNHSPYRGRDVATPYLSCLNLGDPVNDYRLLGNAVYSPSINGSGHLSLRYFFTGSKELGFYELDTPQYVGNFVHFWEEYYLPRYVNIGYYVIDILSQKRISDFFNEYEEAERFATKLYYGNQSKVKGLRFIPGGYFLTPKVVCSSVRRISHPIGFFSYVKTVTGTIPVSKLFSVFRSLLMSGGGFID
jgi:hypothetical protein